MATEINGFNGEANAKHDDQHINMLAFDRVYVRERAGWI
jgi:hypothetical protein